MIHVTMHSKTQCGFCDTSRAWLDANGIPHTEVKHDDDVDRAVMYDGLGLVGGARTVPQFVLVDDGVEYVISGARDLMHTGLESLFGKVSVTILKPAVAVAVSADAVGVEAFEPTCDSCE